MASQDIDLAKRILEAFKHFDCFVFEKDELENVRDFINRSGLNKLVLLRKADPRYEQIYILLPWSLDFEQICISRVKQILAEGGVNQDKYKKDYLLMIDQCINHLERERVREIIKFLESYINRLGGLT